MPEDAVETKEQPVLKGDGIQHFILMSYQRPTQNEFRASQKCWNDQNMLDLELTELKNRNTNTFLIIWNWYAINIIISITQIHPHWYTFILYSLIRYITVMSSKV